MFVFAAACPTSLCIASQCYSAFVLHYSCTYPGRCQYTGSKRMPSPSHVSRSLRAGVVLFDEITAQPVPSQVQNGPISVSGAPFSTSGAFMKLVSVDIGVFRTADPAGIITISLNSDVGGIPGGHWYN
jgi:hypothetical protein